MNSKRGFLLLEFLIGISILSILILGAGTCFHHISQMRVEGLNRLRALSIARTAMEHLCANKPYLIDSSQDQYTIDWQYEHDPYHSFSKVNLHVSWIDPKNRRHSVTLVSGIPYEQS